MTTSAPTAPGQLGVAGTTQQVLDYLGRLDSWLAERRNQFFIYNFNDLLARIESTRNFLAY